VDIIRDIGPLGFASRLKRLAELLQRDVSRVYKTQRLDFEARWFPVMYSLAAHGPLSVTELAVALGLTHPAINQIAAAMSRRGLLESAKDKADERRRILRLSAEGRRLHSSMQPLWDEIASATSQLIDAADPDLLTGISRIEESLTERCMYDRVMARLSSKSSSEFEIVDYQPALKRHFKTLNLEWLKEYFAVEEKDKIVLDNPEAHILSTGGTILFARKDSWVVGTAALIKHEDGVFELCKLAVTKRARRRGIGDRLLWSLIETARKSRGKKIVLQTSPALDQANRLYEKHGFRVTKKKYSWLADYRRETVVMELKL
jgi:DNA-binding MarR family transcriptional regulator/ribosomal protein S18 acetylase RimI-like enzyme